MVLLLTLSAVFIMGGHAGFTCCQGTHSGDFSRCIANDGVSHVDNRGELQTLKRAAKIWGGKLPGTVGGKTPAEKAEGLLKCCRVLSCCHESIPSIDHAPDGPHITVHCSQKQLDGSYKPWISSRHINCVTGAPMGGGYRRLEDQIEAELFSNKLPQQADHLGQLVAPLKVARRRGNGGCVGAEKKGEWCKCNDGYTSGLNWDTGDYLGGHKEKYHVDNIGKPNFGCFPDMSDLWEMLQGAFVIAEEALECTRPPSPPVAPPVYEPTSRPRERERERNRNRDNYYVDPVDQAKAELKTKAAITGGVLAAGVASWVVISAAKCGLGLLAFSAAGAFLCIPVPGPGRRLDMSLPGRRLGLSSLSQLQQPAQVFDFLAQEQESVNILELNSMMENMMMLPQEEVHAEEENILEQIYARIPVSEETKQHVEEYLAAFETLAEYDINLATVAIQEMPPWTIEQLKDRIVIARANPDPIDG